ncbi:exported hypothetical protein [Frankia sp. Hr75.2]|nr:exported hypothetical protein [Frankia sp. Hr75.2]
MAVRRYVALSLAAIALAGFPGVALAGGNVQPDGSAKHAEPFTQPFGKYKVRLTGDISGQQFVREGTLLIEPDPTRYCLLSEEPPGKQEVGEINFASDRRCPGRAGTTILPVSLADIMVSGNVVQLTHTAPIAGDPSVFRDKKCPFYRIDGGTVTLAFSDANKKVAGNVHLKGVHAACSGSYSATLAGERVG